jgi:hypothetical protein
MVLMIRTFPRHFGQLEMSISKTLFRSLAQGIRFDFIASVLLSLLVRDSSESVLTLEPAGTICFLNLQ